MPGVVLGDWYVAVVDVEVLAATFGKLAATGDVPTTQVTADADVNGPKSVKETVPGVPVVPAGGVPSAGLRPITVAVSEIAVPWRTLAADWVVEMLT